MNAAVNSRPTSRVCCISRRVLYNSSSLSHRYYFSRRIMRFSAQRFHCHFYHSNDIIHYYEGEERVSELLFPVVRRRIVNDDTAKRRYNRSSSGCNNNEENNVCFHKSTNCRSTDNCSSTTSSSITSNITTTQNVSPPSWFSNTTRCTLSCSDNNRRSYFIPLANVSTVTRDSSKGEWEEEEEMDYKVRQHGPIPSDHKNNNTLDNYNNNNNDTMTKEDEKENAMNNVDSNIGEILYHQALDAYKQAELIRNQLEDERIREQHNAMERAMQKQIQYNNKNNQKEESLSSSSVQVDAHTSSSKKSSKKSTNNTNRAAGVAVIRTISRQTRQKLQGNDNVQEQSYQQSELCGQLKDERELYDQKTEGKAIPTTTQEWEEKGYQLLTKAAIFCNHPDALVRLGNMALEEANKDNKNNNIIYERRKHHYAAETDSSLPHNTGLPPIERAMNLYRRAGEVGKSAEGWYNLGHLLWEGHSSSSDGNMQIEPNKEMAMEAFHNAIELDDADAMYFVGVQYLNNSTKERKKTDDDEDYESSDCGNDCNDEDDKHRSRRRRSWRLARRMEGLKLVQRAAGVPFKHGGALYYLALLHRNGDEELSIEPNVKKFRKMLDEAAFDGENDEAHFIRAHCLLCGQDGYKQNMIDALRGFETSASLGNADGAVSAGALYYWGGGGLSKEEHDDAGKLTTDLGNSISAMNRPYSSSPLTPQSPIVIPRDREKAFHLYQHAAELGSLDGWRNVASCYALGEGVPQSMETARYILEAMLKDKE